MASAKRRIYWDANAWIGFINNEPDKRTPLRVIWDAAKRGEYEILTSAFSYMEVIYGKNELGQAYSPERSDPLIFGMLDQPHVTRVQLDTEVAKLARSLKRRFHPVLGKRADAVHLASAAYHNVEALHTYDGSDLLPLTGKVERRTGGMLDILAPGDEVFGPLFGVKGDAKGKGEGGKPGG